MSIEHDYFEDLGTLLRGQLHPREHFFLNLAAEESQFLRFSGGKVRQEGTVEDASAELTLLREAENGTLRRTVRSFTLTGLSYADRERARGALTAAREELSVLPADPYAQLPTHAAKSVETAAGQMPAVADAAAALLGPAKGLGVYELTGIYAAGRIVRGMLDSSGSSHWFMTDRCSVDYSIYAPNQKAAKDTYATAHWDQREWEKKLAASRVTAEALNQPVQALPPGSYRVYLSPTCVSQLAAMLSWYTIGERYLRQGISPLRWLRSGERSFSPLFSLDEDFSGGQAPRFNEAGELAPLRLPLISGGKLVSTLISPESAREFKLQSNGATGAESLRAARIHPASPGQGFAEDQARQRLGDGLELSHLHYLNWSDHSSARVTGMTRFACFRVQGGRRVAPIENLRFDDTLFALFGTALEALTEETRLIPDVHTYERRSLEGISAPGALVSAMRFTL